MGRRTLMLIAALLLAALGTALVFLYVTRTTDSFNNRAEDIEVLQATTALPQGTSANSLKQNEHFATTRIPRGKAPTDALTLAQLKSLGSQQLLHTVDKDTYLQRAMFSGAGEAVAADYITKGMLAVQVPLSNPARVAGLLHNGSKISIFVTISGGKEPKETHLLLDHVKVITAGGSLPPTASGAVPQELVTVEVDQNRAGVLIYALDSGGVESNHLWFTLEGPEFTPLSPTPSIPQSSLAPGVNK